MAISRICLVIPSLNPGGMERVMSELAVYFCNQPSVEVHLVMYGIIPELFYQIPSNILIHKPDWMFDNSKRTWHTIKRMFFLRQTIKKIDPSTILSFGEYWNSLVLLSLWGLKYPIYVSDRCQPDKSLGRIQDLLRNWLYPRAKGVIAQTHIAKEIYLKQYNHSNIEVIGNPIREIKPQGRAFEREKIILSAGRLISTKNFDMLIDIFVNMDKPDWKLVIVGGDAIKQNGMAKLTAKIDALGMKDRIILTGNISNVDDYYRKSSIFAFTSSSEGFPNVIGEAMSAGLPIVAFDCMAGPSDLIADGVNGFLIPLFSLKSFTNRLSELTDNDFLRNEFGIKSKLKISEFSISNVANRYLSFITNK